MKILILFFLGMLNTCLLFGQQLGLTSLYRFNTLVLNPAATNHSYIIDNKKTSMVNATYRAQWTGFEGAPVNYTLRFEHMPEEHPIKVGGYLYGERAGAIGYNGGFFNFAYLLYLNDNLFSKKYFSIGTNVGLVNYRVDVNQIKLQVPQPELFGADGFQEWYADMSFGAFYHSRKKDPHVILSIPFSGFYAGISVPQTFTLNFDTPEDVNYTLERIRHYYFIAGALITPHNRLLIEPSTWIRYTENFQYQTLFDNSPVSGDVNLRIQYDNLVWGGVGFGTNRLAHFEAGVSIGQGIHPDDNKSYALTIGFAYDAPIGWEGWLGPSFEVSIGAGWK